MQTLDILLIVICGAGLIHGLTLSTYFGFIKSKRGLSDKFLAIVLFLMALRVGKSIVLEFDQDLEFLFIFLGLSTLLLIGPLLFWYINSLIHTNFKLRLLHYLQIIPFLFVLGISPFVSEQWFIENGTHWAYILLVGIYLHLAAYICASGIDLYRFQRNTLNTPKTKPQVRVIKWLRYVLIGITFIWISYVLNIFEDRVPYILGPLIYTAFIYALTYIAYPLKVHKLNSRSVEVSDSNSHIYSEIIAVLEKDNMYMSSDISLHKLGELTGYSKHLISASINSYAQMNFNNLVNYYRIQKAKEILGARESSKYTISSIAYDTGFNSLSSFNAAFKKFTKTTPSQFRSVCE
ncbi:MAG: helix-turn-helix transcriptional regulator [Bacteroidota bacterium]